ncbi:MAG TPA: flagellar protein FliT [Nitrosomonas mobilis]|nr:flagellar protein FliT [Nitrosomonas mobilis]
MIENNSTNHTAEYMNGAQTIAAYEGILAITGKMLQAAQASDWDGLVALEQECKHITSRLIGQQTQHKLDESQQKKKIALIQQILAHDAAIRAVTEPWMMHLQNLLTSSHHKQQLNQAYRAD